MTLHTPDLTREIPHHWSPVGLPDPGDSGKPAGTDKLADPMAYIKSLECDWTTALFLNYSDNHVSSRPAKTIYHVFYHGRDMGGVGLRRPLLNWNGSTDSTLAIVHGP